MMYNVTVVVVKEGEPYKDIYGNPRTGKSVYEQTFPELDVSKLATFLNSQPVKRSHKRKEKQ